MRELSFSSVLLKVYEVPSNGMYKLKKPSLVVNLTSSPITIEADKSSINNLESRFLRNTDLRAENAVVCLLQIEGDNFLNPPGNIAEFIKSTWTPTRELFPEMEEYKTRIMYRSSIDRINEYNLNFWFLAANTLNRIHDDHITEELHMGIMGLGIMQKYHEKSYDSLYETVYVTPGHIHLPFFKRDNEKVVYPLHSFNSITDCIWMRIEKVE